MSARRVSSQAVGQQQGHGASQAQVLAQHGEDQVGPRRRQVGGGQQARARARDATLGQGEQALQRLVARSGGVGPGVEPDIHPPSDVGEVVVGRHHPDGKQRHGEHDVNGAPRGQVHHGHEQAEEERRGAQVALAHEQGQAQGDHQQHGGQVARLQHRHPQAPRGHPAQHPGLLGHKAGQEDDHQQFGQLTRLEAEAATEAEPQPCAVALHAEGHGGDHQPQGQRTGQVLPVGQRAYPVHQGVGAHQGRAADHHPQDLLGGLRAGQPVQQDHPQGGQQGDQGEQHPVTPRPQQVQQQGGGHQGAGRGQGAQRPAPMLAQAQGCEGQGQGGDGGRHHQQAEFPTSRSGYGVSLHCGGRPSWGPAGVPCSAAWCRPPRSRHRRAGPHPRSPAAR